MPGGSQQSMAMLGMWKSAAETMVSAGLFFSCTPWTLFQIPASDLLNKYPLRG